MKDYSATYMNIMSCILKEPKLAADIEAEMLNDAAAIEIVKTLQKHLQTNPNLDELNAYCIVEDSCSENAQQRYREIEQYHLKHVNDYRIQDFDRYTHRIRHKHYIEGSTAILQNLQKQLQQPDANPVLLYDEALEAVKQLSYKVADTSAAVSVKELIESGEYERFLNSTTNKIPTQFASLNKALHGGFSVGHLVTIAAKPSDGKTELMVEMAEHIAYKEQRHVLYFTMEMGKCEITTRLMQSRGTVSHNDMRTDEHGQFANPNAVTTRMGALLKNDCFHIIDGIREQKQILNEIRKSCKAKQCDIAFIDYLGLINPQAKAENRTRELAVTSAALKDLADTLQIPIVIAQQYDRNATGMPTMNKIRESGDIAANSSEVLLLYNPDHDTEAPDIWGNHIAVNLDKNREGERGCFIFAHNGEFKNFIQEPDLALCESLLHDLAHPEKRKEQF